MTTTRTLALRTTAWVIVLGTLLAVSGALIAFAAPIAPATITGGGAPDTPAFSSATALSATEVRLNWNIIPPASGYNVYRSDTQSGTFTRLGDEPTVTGAMNTTYTDTSVLPSTTYHYKISAVNTPVESAASVVPVGVTTPAAPSTGTTSSATSTPSTTDDNPSTNDTTTGAATSTPSTIDDNPSVSDTTGGAATSTGSTVGTSGVAATIESLLKQVVALQAKLAATQGGTGATAGTKFVRQLSLGTKGNEVTSLQNFLKTQGADIYPEGLATGYFGALTEKAVGRFQEKHGIAKPGDAGYGRVGPKTLAKMNELIGS